MTLKQAVTPSLPPIVLLDREPPLFGIPELSALLIRAVELKASDVVLKPGDPVWLSLHGEWLPATRRRLVPPEIAGLLNETSRHPSASAQVDSGTAMDYAYEVPVDRLSRARFRVNATRCRTSRGSGIELTLRSIPGVPPELSDLALEPGILEAVFPLYGLVMTTGPVGSGKTTLQAAVLAHSARTRPRRILTYEAPVEFDLDGIPDRIAPVTQTEIPYDLKNFSDSGRNSLRRAGNIILVGECRDADTFRSLLEDAQTGVAVYSTAHTNGVSDTISRAADVFPWEERAGMTRTMIAALRLVIHQRLFPSPKGGRVAVREYLAFTPEIRQTLLREELGTLGSRIGELVEGCGQTLAQDARAKTEAGLLSEETLEEILRTTGEGSSPKGVPGTGGNLPAFPPEIRQILLGAMAGLPGATRIGELMESLRARDVA